MKPGAIIRLPDGRDATIVYSGLDGYGIRWGRVKVDAETILSLNPLFGTAPSDYPWMPEAMLREPYNSCGLPCVGTEYEIVEEA